MSLSYRQYMLLWSMCYESRDSDNGGRQGDEYGDGAKYRLERNRHGED